MPEPKEATTDALRRWRQHRARAALALLAEDPGQAALLTARLFEEGLDPAEMILVRDALKPLVVNKVIVSQSGPSLLSGRDPAGRS